jgi:hypothetical protein
MARAIGELDLDLRTVMGGIRGGVRLTRLPPPARAQRRDVQA